MNIPNIDSKIMARAFALAMAVKIRSSILRGNNKYSPNGTVLEQAKDFEKYLIGDAKLPEVPIDSTNILTVDLAELPKDWDINKWIEYIEKYNINIKDSFYAANKTKF